MPNNKETWKRIEDKLKNNLPQAKPVHRRSVYSLLGVVKGWVNKHFVIEKIIEKEIIIYKNKYPKKKKSKQSKIFVGQNACCRHDTETGITCLSVVDCPYEIEYQDYCPYEDSIGLCLYGRQCDFAREVTHYDLKNYPELFEEEQIEPLVEDED